MPRNTTIRFRTIECLGAELYKMLVTAMRDGISALCPKEAVHALAAEVVLPVSFVCDALGLNAGVLAAAVRACVAP